MRYKPLQRSGIKDLINRIDQEDKYMQDFIIPAEDLRFDSAFDASVNKTDYHIVARSSDSDIINRKSPMLEKAERNLSAKLKMPWAYFQYLKSNHSDLLIENLNTLSFRSSDRFMLRTFKGNAPFIEFNDPKSYDDTRNNPSIVRSVLSNRYKRIDNYDVINAVLHAISDSGVEVEPVSASITENHMFVDFVSKNPQQFPELFDGYRPPDNSRNMGADTEIVSGFSIRNSETGSSRFQIVPRMVVMACSNGITMRADAMSRTHLGSKITENGVIWSSKTIAKERDLIVSQTHDAVKQFLSPDFLGMKVNEILKHRRELDHPHGAAHHLSKELSFDKNETEQLVEALFSSGDKTTTGLLHASTWVAGGSDVERQYEIEEQAYELLPTMYKFDKEA